MLWVWSALKAGGWVSVSRCRARLSAGAASVTLRADIRDSISIRSERTAVISAERGKDGMRAFERTGV